jgi:pilus assembly protein TadC
MSSTSLAAVLTAAAVLALPHRAAQSVRRLERALAGGWVPVPGGGRGDRPAIGRPLPAWAWRPVAGAAFGAVLAGHGLAAAVLAVAAGALAGPARRATRRTAAERARAVRDLTRAADLLGVCLEAGSTLPDALRTVADVLPEAGSVAARLRSAAALLQVGGDPADVAADGPGDDPARRLLRTVARAARTGAALTEALRDLADEERDRARWAALERARRAGVRAVGPLAACFLPAFVLVGVVPVVVGVAGTVLGDLS